MTLAVADGLDLTAAERLVADVARSTRPVLVTFSNLGAGMPLLKLLMAATSTVWPSVQKYARRGSSTAKRL